MELKTLKEILAKLADGDVQKIAAKTDRSRNAVYMVFRKICFVDVIIETALDLIEQTALDNLKFVQEKRTELKQAKKEYESKKRKGIQKPFQKQAA